MKPKRKFNREAAREVARIDGWDQDEAGLWFHKGRKIKGQFTLQQVVDRYFSDAMLNTVRRMAEERR